MTAAESRRLVDAGRSGRRRQRGQLQHPLLPAQPARPRRRHRRRDRRRPTRDRPLLPGLAAARERLELAPRAGPRRRAPGGRRHRLALARPDDVRDRPAGRVGHGRPRDVHRGAARADRPGRDVLDRRGRRDRRPARSPPRTRRRSCCASRTAHAARSASARSAPAGRTRSSTRSTARLVARLGLGAARPDLARPSRAAQRDPHQEPGAHGRRPDAPRRPSRAVTSRASATRSPPISARSTRTSRRAARPPIPTYPTFADGHDEMLVNDAIAESARLGRWVDVVARPDRRPVRPATEAHIR